MKNSNTLCNCPLFSGKDKKAIKETLSKTRYIISQYSQNDFIFRKGQPSDYIGIVLNGFIEIQNNLKSGKYIIVLYKREGEVFGFESVFSDSTSYQFDVIAKKRCDILLIHKQSILDVISKDRIICNNILNIFANNTLALNRIIELFSYSSIQEKMAYCLLYNMSINNCNIIKLPFSKQTWAKHLNISRSSLCRELKKLCNDEIITVDNRVVKILKREKLESILDEEL